MKAMRSFFLFVILAASGCTTVGRFQAPELLFNTSAPMV